MMLPMDVFWIPFLPNSIKLIGGKDAEMAWKENIHQPGSHVLHGFTFSYFITYVNIFHHVICSLMKYTAECFANCYWYFLYSPHLHNSVNYKKLFRYFFLYILV